MPNFIYTEKYLSQNLNIKKERKKYLHNFYLRNGIMLYREISINQPEYIKISTFYVDLKF